MANGASSQRVGEIVDHAGFGNNKRIACAQGGEHFGRGVLDLFGRNDIVEAVNVAVVELVVVEVIFLLLPLADVGCGAGAYQVAVAHLADATNVFEAEDVRVHGGDEKARIVGAAEADVAHAQEDVGAYLQCARGARERCCAASRGGGSDKLHDSGDHVRLACARCPCRREVDVVIDANHLAVPDGNTGDGGSRLGRGSGGSRGIKESLLLLLLLETRLGGGQAGSSERRGSHDAVAGWPCEE